MNPRAARGGCALRIVTFTPNPAVDRTLVVEGFDRSIAEGEKRLLRAAVEREMPAGKGLNVSRCLSALGLESIAVAPVSRGLLDLFERSFEGTLVRPRFLEREGRTRTNVTVRDPGTGSETHIREAGMRLTGEEWSELSSGLLSAAGEGALVVCCGSLPPGVAPEALRELLARVKDSASLALDTSGPALREAARTAQLLKPNEEELALVAPGLGPREGAGKLVGEGAEVVLVTLGRRGAVLATREGTWRASAPAVEAVNTVGAGDAALAGLVWGLAEGAEGPELLRRAVACAASAVLQPGAGELDRRQAERFMDQVALREA